MRRLTLIIALLATACAVLMVPAGATAAKRKKAKNPTVTSVSPMRIKPRRNLVIRGSNFSRSRRRNTIIFAVGRRSIFVKPSRASSRRLVVTLPVSLERLMRREDGGLVPTRFSLKVAAGRKFSRKTARRLSPVIVPLSSAKITVPGPSGGTGGGGGAGGGGTFVPSDDCDNDGTPNNADAASDVDLLSDALERSLKTDPCDADTDADGAEDGYEYRSALDLNHYPRTPPLPYPGKRPYPNALDPSDGNTDYDGDSLTLREEHLLWMRYSADGARRSGHPTGNITSPSTPVNYSDGLQKTIDPAPFAPSDALSLWVQDVDGDGRLDDDERDGDADGLSNYDESHGRFTEVWWVSQYDGTNAPKESKYPGLDFLDNEDTPLNDALADNDLDGDTVVDGLDDHDHDGLTNKFEIRRGGDPLWGYVQPFNPCKPVNSERCHRHPPFGYYQNDTNPPIGPEPPAGYPDNTTPARPATPNG